jgi:CheY-like chemotaxis protein
MEEATRDIPVIVLTADATETARTPMIDILATGFVNKPIGVGPLLDLVDRFSGYSAPSAGT